VVVRAIRGFLPRGDLYPYNPTVSTYIYHLGKYKYESYYPNTKEVPVKKVPKRPNDRCNFSVFNDLVVRARDFRRKCLQALQNQEHAEIVTN
jgi:hypothetical protein